ncbi:DNase I-like protein [Dioscorea alata]|uniref:DNase I-like protein n=1 Tax=Dioscorea alata TaxID=55571 RepID=A0ACB7UC93_DIOAL|nr:DNase I-like protein [Dioscorea alata]
MNLITWNVRGLGRPAKRFLVKDFLLMHFADLCCLQESKLEGISPSIWREIGGGRLDQFLMVLARRSPGGIIIGWNSVLMSAKLLSAGTFSLTMEFYSKFNNLI